MNKFQSVLNGTHTGRPVIWVMRQAGRYHSHYQQMKADHTFLELCRDPDLAAETAMGPMNDFGFDAAILFSDILFPFDAMGCAVDFNPGPQFEFLLKTTADIERLKPANDDYFNFQKIAIGKTRKQLPSDKGLLGFIGGVFTLYAFGVEGTGKEGGTDALKGLQDGRFKAFVDKITPTLIQNYNLQAQAKPDCMAIFDSGTKILSEDDFNTHYFPVLKTLFTAFKSAHPDMPILYYTKGLPISCVTKIMHELPISVLGVDDESDIVEIAKRKPPHLVLQGNIPPEWTTRDPSEFKTLVDDYAAKIAPHMDTTKWIFSLGHGVVPQTREENIRYLVKKVQEWPI